MRHTLVISALLATVTWASADPKICITKYDQQATMWLTRCSDGSRLVTTYDEQFKRYRTQEIAKPRHEKAKKFGVFTLD
ncbi:MAG TPA: hypothetical protein VLK82_08210 [Candidatus Tectomicrobia bacterium]|nr:hypothetical protein [Candidatus Tectomicrobia bacterium]